MDENIDARLLHCLEKKGQLNDTAITLQSFEDRLLPWRMAVLRQALHARATPIRMPVMLRYQKRVPAGVVRDRDDPRRRHCW